MNGEEIALPSYSFEDGKRHFKGEKLRLEEDTILIMEGIHALNPELIQSIPQDAIFKIYVSALTTISIDEHNWIPTADTRLLRRIIRDYRYRGYSARDTISRWPSVRRGEEKWIFPYQENADVMFNSALAYEISTLKPLVEPLLRQVSFGTPEHIEAKRLLKFLEWFLPTTTEFVPDNSLLREFIGGSILTDFSMWNR